MRKVLSMFLICGVMFLMSTQVFAAAVNNENNKGGTLTVDADIPLNLNFSPSVAGQYATDGTDADEQWYTVATYHSGGTIFYGSGSDQTSVFKRTRGTNQAFSDAVVPEVQALDADGNPEPWVELDTNGDPVVDNWYR